MSNDSFGGWGMLEWAVTTAWGACVTIAGFLWRLQTRVEVLEHSHEYNEESTERRHKENLEAWRHLEDKIERLTGRIDKIVDRREQRGS